jgi:hypothetical protein
MQLTPTSNLSALRAAIYAATGVAHYSKGYRPRKLRRVCALARGLDLRKAAHVVYLAQQLGLISKPTLIAVPSASPLAA